MAYEFDNGDFSLVHGNWFWELQKNTAALHTTFTDLGYADAGVVVDLGLADNFTGISAVTTGPMAINIWIGDGSEANTPGQYGNPDFTYGYKTNAGTYQIFGGPNLTAAQIASDYSSYEVYAWVGLDYLGTSVSGSVSSVNGHATGNRTVSFTNNGDGTVTVVMH